MSDSTKNLFVKENYLFMLDKLGSSAKNEIIERNYCSAATERRIRNGEASNISDSTIEEIIRYYNEHGEKLYPHHVSINEFKYNNLSEYIAPTWTNKQVEGNYIGLYLSKRGNRKAKAMILTITQNSDFMLEARAIDTVHNLDVAEKFITEILKKPDLEEARKIHKEQLVSKYSLLRGSRFLHGEVTGRGDLMLIHLKNEQGTYEMTLSTSLKSYLKNCAIVAKERKYDWRGGATIASVYDSDDWPYSMIIGFIRDTCWHPDLMDKEEITDSLQRMYNYQKKQNMLCLQNDIDALFYESIMDIHHLYESHKDEAY